MAVQVGKTRPVKKPAPGDAPNTGAPGPTPAPVKYVNPPLAERDFTPGYGTNHAPGSSSLTPGEKATSALADNLKAKAAEGDAGDLLQTIIERGTSRGSAAQVELQSPQTREVDKSPYPATFGMKGASAGPKVPSKLGQSVFDPTQVRKPGQ